MPLLRALGRGHCRAAPAPALPRDFRGRIRPFQLPLAELLWGLAVLGRVPPCHCHLLLPIPPQRAVLGRQPGASLKQALGKAIFPSRNISGGSGGLSPVLAVPKPWGQCPRRSLAATARRNVWSWCCTKEQHGGKLGGLPGFSAFSWDCTNWERCRLSSGACFLG